MNQQYGNASSQTFVRITVDRKMQDQNMENITDWNM